MTKKWLKNYFLISLILALLFTSICSFTLTRNNLSQADSKRIFESIYKNTKIDFIIPSPSYDQISELEGSNGIDAITPYYQTNTEVSCGSLSVDSDVLAFPFVEKMENTPYNDERILSGADSFDEGDAIIDFTYAEKNNITIGDDISVRIGDNHFDFTVVAISETNTYCDKGSVALVLSSENVAELNEDGLSYSAAYVHASDINDCERFLMNDYIPYGRLKDRDMFSSDDSYNAHVENFNETDWSKEVTNCKSNYELDSYKYDNVDASILTNAIIHGVILLVVLVVFNCILLFSSPAKRFMQSYLVKRSGKVSKISSHYISGIFFEMILFLLGICGFYYVLSSGRETPYMGSNLINAIIPGALVIIVSVVLMVIAKAFVKNNYKVSK